MQRDRNINQNINFEPCGKHFNFFFFFFFRQVINIYLYKKKTPKYTGSIQGCTDQIQKLHKSSKFKIEEKGCFLHTDNQSDKVLKTKNPTSI